MIKLGDRIKVKPVTFDTPGNDGKPKEISETVVYIHPEGRAHKIRRSYRRREKMGHEMVGNRPGM